MAPTAHRSVIGAHVVLTAPLLLAGCSATADGQDPATAAIIARQSAALLAMAQVNATILAFVLGLGLIALQMASRWAIPNLTLQVVTWRGLFVLLYAILGVAAPLALSYVNPTEFNTWLALGLSVGQTRWMPWAIDTSEALPTWPERK